MAENSNIEWTDHTFNPWEGCQKVGPGCDHCYAETRNSRFSGGIAINWGPGAPRRRTSPANWRKPIAWNAAHEKFFAEHGRRQRVFCASLADVFDNEVDPNWRADLFQLVEKTPNLDWLLLTKRVGNVIPMMNDVAARLFWLDHLDNGALPENVWLGATIVNRTEMLRDGPRLKTVPARVHFWSVEPLLGSLGHIPPELMPGWIIGGGESGPKARPMQGDWARSLRDQCAAAGVPFLFKQWGEWIDGDQADSNANDKLWSRRSHFDMRDAGLIATIPPKPPGPPYFACNYTVRLGKKAAGRLLDGVQHDGYPTPIAA